MSSAEPLQAPTGLLPGLGLPPPAAAPPAPPDGRAGSWLRDFRYEDGRLRVLTTGAEVTLDATIAGEALSWLRYHAAVRARAWMLAVRGEPGPKVWFSPQAPRPWYLIWSALAWMGGSLASSPQEADFHFSFEDATWARRGAGLPAGAFNADCLDVSKSTVAAIFEEVFGYPLALDPTTWLGEAVEKSELNGAHDGRLVQCPTPLREGYCHQHLIDTGDEVFSEDLRTACVGGTPVAVWIKRKTKAQRFSIHNLAVTLHEPREVFSADELAVIGRFLARMEIDWAGLDILRDRHSGRLYVVDVNKTDVGPIIALSWRDKLRSTALLADALRDLLSSSRASPALDIRDAPSHAGAPARLARRARVD